MNRSLRALPALLFLAAFPLFAMLMQTRPARAAEGVPFQTDYKKALAMAKRANKPVMMDVYTDWCGWCKKLDADVYSKPEVTRAVAQGFIPLKINPEANAANRAFVSKFGVRGYPTIVFLNASGKQIHQSVGYRPAPEFLKELAVARAKARK